MMNEVTLKAPPTALFLFRHSHPSALSSQLSDLSTQHSALGRMFLTTMVFSVALEAVSGATTTGANPLITSAPCM
ncbi:hypothetical protein E2C01_086830 [Portunus trituberculatus]|uniref:Uncharacterized protein n=1 Tax=Portunus trituberculatus TaxID=210409 RepID=A0A5B7J6E7_PORTR|nr:hypothetical protein [Portunus trituberculatus]